MSPLVKAIAACMLAEILMLAVFGAITHSLVSAVTCSVALGGPMTVWLAPMLLRRFRAQARSMLMPGLH